MPHALEKARFPALAVRKDLGDIQDKRTSIGDTSDSSIKLRNPECPKPPLSPL